MVFFILAVDNYTESEPLLELYPFQECFPGFFGLNCKMKCHCDKSCTCDPVVGCSRCDENEGCHLLYQGFPHCLGKIHHLECLVFKLTFVSKVTLCPNLLQACVAFEGLLIDCFKTDG